MSSNSTEKQFISVGFFCSETRLSVMKDPVSEHSSIS